MNERPATAPNSGIAVYRYDSIGDSGAAHHAAWAKRRAHSMARMFDTEPLEPFAAESDQIALADLSITYAKITAQVWRRRPTHIKADGADALTVNWRFAGAATGSVHGRRFVAGAGSIILMDLAQPSEHVSESSQTILLIVPRTIAEERFGPVADLHGLVIDGPAATMFGSHLQQIRKSVPLLTVADGATLAETVLALLGIALSSVGRQTAQSADAVESALKRRLCAIIDAEIGSARLDVKSLCLRGGLSRSRLFRLFANEGGVETYIRNRRLDHARFALLNPASAERIGDIGLRLGFADVAHFSRAFRKRFGIPPSDFRALGVAS